MSACAVTSDAAGKTRGSFRPRLPRRTTQCLLAEGRRKCPQASSWRTTRGRLVGASARAVIVGRHRGGWGKGPPKPSSSGAVGETSGSVQPCGHRRTAWGSWAGASVAFHCRHRRLYAWRLCTWRLEACTWRDISVCVIPASYSNFNSSMIEN